MGTNKLVMLIVGVLAVIVSVVIFNSVNQPELNADPAATAQMQKAKSKTKESPVVQDGDTVAETLKEVQARYQSTLDGQDSLENKIKELEQELARQTRRRNGKPGAKGEADPLVTEFKDKISSLSNDVETLANQLRVQKHQQTATENGYQLSLEDLGLGNRKSEQAPGAPVGTLPGYARIVPMTQSSDAPDDSAVDSALSLAKRKFKEKSSSDYSDSRLVNTLKENGGLGEVKKVYTIPARSTLFEGVAMTALIGTVPVGGKVTDPFPAKFIVGENNLATNGLRIPGLKGIVFEGVARGNWNLSCVSVAITGGTYTFQDGRIQHLTFDRQGGSGGKQYQATSPYSEGEANKSIAYITNPQGVPCIPGQRVTDAHRQLATMGLLGMSASYFDAKAAAETTSSTNPITGGDNRSVTGDKSAFINNTTYADATRTVMQFYEDRMGDSFDAIYVDPAAKVVLNITQDLYIDYVSTNRKLAYQTGGSHVNQLD